MEWKWFSIITTLNYSPLRHYMISKQRTLSLNKNITALCGYMRYAETLNGANTYGFI